MSESSPLTRLASRSRTFCAVAPAAAICAVSSLTFVSACSRSKRLPAPVLTSSVFCATRFFASSSEAVRTPICPVASFSCSSSSRSVVVAVGGGRFREPRAGFRRLGAIGPYASLFGAKLGDERVDLVLVGRRIDLEEHVALLHRTVVLDRDLEHPSAHLGDDGHDVIHHAHVRGGRREDVEQQQHRRDGHDREDRDADFPGRRPWQQLQLDEDQPDEERVDAEEKDFHLPLSVPGPEFKGLQALAKQGDLVV
jgi:hypothetical protein